MIDRTGDFSPTGQEVSVVSNSQGPNALLKEGSFLTYSKNQLQHDEESVGVLTKIHNTLSGNNLKVKVSNFRSGITTPIIDYMESGKREAEDKVVRRHKESILYMADLRRTIQETSQAGTKSVTNSIRETYFSITKSVVSAIATVIKPIMKTAGFILFGTGGKQKSVVQAIEEQTQFMRTGNIFDTGTFYTRFMRRGVVGSALSGVAGAAGVGRGAAQNAEDKRARGQELTAREKLVTAMNIQLGWFKDFDRRDVKRTTQQNSPEFEQVSMMDRVRLAVESFMNHYDTAANIIVNDLVDLKALVRFNSMSIVSAIALASDNITGAIEYYNTSSITEDNQNNRDLISTLGYYNSRQSNILDSVRDELNLLNAPVMSEYERRSLFIQNEQHDMLVEANRLAEERRAAGDEKVKSGGLIDSIIGLVFRSKLGKTIGRLGKRFIIAPIMGAIKAGGSWIKKNGFKFLLRLPFAKVFAVGMISGLLYKYLARPMIDWFDNKFNTDIGGSIDRFGNFISDKFSSVLDWIREKMASIPVIGKYFEKDEPKIPKSPKSDVFPDMSENRRKSMTTTERIVDRVSGLVPNSVTSMYNRGTEQVGSIVDWYKGQWGSMLPVVSRGFDEATSFIADTGKDLYKSATDKIDKIRTPENETPDIIQFQRRLNESRGMETPTQMPSTLDIRLEGAMNRIMNEQKNSTEKQLKEERERNSTMIQQTQEMLNTLKNIANNTLDGANAPLIAARLQQATQRQESLLNTGGSDFE